MQISHGEFELSIFEIVKNQIVKFFCQLKNSTKNKQFVLMLEWSVPWSRQRLEVAPVNLDLGPKLCLKIKFPQIIKSSVIIALSTKQIKFVTPLIHANSSICSCNRLCFSFGIWNNFSDQLLSRVFISKNYYFIGAEAWHEATEADKTIVGE